MYSHAGNRIIPLADNLSPKMREVLEGYAAGNSPLKTETANGQKQLSIGIRAVGLGQHI